MDCNELLELRKESEIMREREVNCARDRKDMWDTRERYRAENAVLTLALAEAREALKKHGRHRFMCLCSKDRGAKCHCGLDAAHTPPQQER